MVHSHPSTPQQRAQWIGQMLAHAGTYGVVTQLSRTHAPARTRCARAMSRTVAPAPPSQPLAEAAPVAVALVVARATRHGHARPVVGHRRRVHIGLQH